MVDHRDEIVDLGDAGQVLRTEWPDGTVQYAHRAERGEVWGQPITPQAVA